MLTSIIYIHLMELAVFEAGETYTKILNFNLHTISSILAIYEQISRI